MVVLRLGSTYLTTGRVTAPSTDGLAAGVVPGTLFLFVCLVYTTAIFNIE